MINTPCIYNNAHSKAMLDVMSLKYDATYIIL